MRHTVLIIEDNDINREILQEILQPDYDLLLAENGLAGLELLRTHYAEIKVVLLDIEMPLMNGHELLETKAKESAICDIPVIVTTGSEASQEEIRCLQMGASDFVRKPYNPVVVRLRVKNFISLSESAETIRQKTLFIQNVSHELRTPMNAVIGFSQMLDSMRDLMEPEESSLYLSYVLSNSMAMMEMIDNMIVLTDLDSGNFVSSTTELSINGLCQSVINKIEYCVPEGVSVNFSTEVPDNYLVTSNEKYLEHMLKNYLTNACKFTKAGQITVHCAPSKQKGYCTVSVTDTGIGIPEDRAESIFNRFEKVDAFTQGMGLGLALVRKLAKNLGIQAYLDTRHTPGSRFVLEIHL